MKKKTMKLPEYCTAMRHVHVRTGTLDLRTGTMTFPDEGVEVTQPCNVPLFGSFQRETGRCRTCYADPAWAMEGNRPATVAEITTYRTTRGVP